MARHWRAISAVRPSLVVEGNSSLTHAEINKSVKAKLIEMVKTGQVREGEQFKVWIYSRDPEKNGKKEAMYTIVAKKTRSIPYVRRQDRNKKAPAKPSKKPTASKKPSGAKKASKPAPKKKSAAS
jgi:hypothetical protein